MKNTTHKTLYHIKKRFIEEYNQALKEEGKEAREKRKIYGKEIWRIKKDIKETQRTREKEEHMKLLELLAKWPVRF